MTGLLPRVLQDKLWSQKSLPREEATAAAGSPPGAAGETMVTPLTRDIILQAPIHHDKVIPPMLLAGTPLGHTPPQLHYKSTIILWLRVQVCLLFLFYSNSLSNLFFFKSPISLSKTYLLTTGT